MSTELLKAYVYNEPVAVNASTGLLGMIMIHFIEVHASETVHSCCMNTLDEPGSETSMNGQLCEYFPLKLYRKSYTHVCLA